LAGVGWFYYLEVSCVDEDCGSRLVRYENIEHSPVLLHFFFLLPSKKRHVIFYQQFLAEKVM
jgi:hypothetical protein